MREFILFVFVLVSCSEQNQDVSIKKRDSVKFKNVTKNCLNEAKHLKSIDSSITQVLDSIKINCASRDSIIKKIYETTKDFD